MKKILSFLFICFSLHFSFAQQERDSRDFRTLHQLPKNTAAFTIYDLPQIRNTAACFPEDEELLNFYDGIPYMEINAPLNPTIKEPLKKVLRKWCNGEDHIAGIDFSGYLVSVILRDSLNSYYRYAASWCNSLNENAICKDKNLKERLLILPLLNTADFVKFIQELGFQGDDSLYYQCRGPEDWTTIIIHRDFADIYTEQLLSPNLYDMEYSQQPIYPKLKLDQEYPAVMSNLGVITWVNISDTMQKGYFPTGKIYSLLYEDSTSYPYPTRIKEYPLAGQETIDCYPYDKELLSYIHPNPSQVSYNREKQQFTGERKYRFFATSFVDSTSVPNKLLEQISSCITSHDVTVSYESDIDLSYTDYWLVKVENPELLLKLIEKTVTEYNAVNGATPAQIEELLKIKKQRNLTEKEEKILQSYLKFSHTKTKNADLITLNETKLALRGNYLMSTEYDTLALRHFINGEPFDVKENHHRQEIEQGNLTHYEFDNTEIMMGIRAANRWELWNGLPIGYVYNATYKRTSNGLAELTGDGLDLQYAFYRRFVHYPFVIQYIKW